MKKRKCCFIKNKEKRNKKGIRIFRKSMKLKLMKKIPFQTWIKKSPKNFSIFPKEIQLILIKIMFRVLITPRENLNKKIKIKLIRLSIKKRCKIRFQRLKKKNILKNKIRKKITIYKWNLNKIRDKK